MPARTFLALDLDEAIRDRLLAIESRIDAGGATIRWVDRPQLHVTLKFLGDVPDELAADVCARAAEAAAQVEPFDFSVRGLICAPASGRQLRMFWAGVQDPTSRMAELHRRLNAALAGLGLKEENRAFKPHVTLARVRFVKDPQRLRSLAEPCRDEEFGAQHAAEVVVYTSQLTPRGPIYTPVAKPPLGG